MVACSFTILNQILLKAIMSVTYRMHFEILCVYLRECVCLHRNFHCAYVYGTVV